MTIKTLAAVFVLASSVFSASIYAETANTAVAPTPTLALTSGLPIFTPAPMLAQSVLPASADALLAAVAKVDDAAETATDDTGDSAADLRKELIDLAMTLRHTPYVRGGHDPSTGFDCSGFVRYVFSRALGLHLPANSASQFLAGLKVKRADMQPGDLVFFRTAGRHGRGRVSHVGIYIANGRFIHSPSHGETVRIDNLTDRYWAKRFADAKRPEGLAQIDSGNG